MKWVPGELDQRIKISREALTTDAGGGQTVALSVLTTVWAKVIAKSTRERETSDRLDASGLYTFIIRYRADIRENDRITWGGNDYNVRGIPREGGRKLYLEIDAERGVAL
jgi:SPP1 family predicted phage head-tail adaptor